MRAVGDLRVQDRYKRLDALDAAETALIGLLETEEEACVGVEKLEGRGAR